MTVTDIAPDERTNDARRRALGWVLATAMVAPPIVAVIVMAGRTWHPVDDFAIIDLRVRDIWSAHPPLTGLFSRPGWNHPGPVLFWLIALVSGPFGQAPWATRVGGALIDVGAMVWLAWVTWRSGLRMMLAAAAVVGMTYLAIGPHVIRQPWNLHIPLVALPLVLFLALIVATGNSRRLIGLAIAATIVVQTHVGFVLPTATAIVFAVACVGIDARRARRLPERWRSTLLITGLASAVLWLPVIVDTIAHWPGNLGKIVRYFAAGEYHHIGLSSATGILADEFRVLPPWLGGSNRRALFTAFAEPSPRVWLLIPVALLVVGALAAWRTGRTADRRTVVLAAALFIVAVFAISRADEPRAYTFEWRAVVAAFIVTAAVQAVASWAPNTRVMPAVAGAVAVVLVAWGAIDLGIRVTDDGTAPLEERAPALTTVLPVIRATPDTEQIMVRHAGTSLLSLFDGVVNELDRAGVDVSVDAQRGRIFGSERVSTSDDVDETWYVTEQGSTVPGLLAQPGARLVASTSPLSAEEDAELDRLQALLRSQLLRAGRPGVVKLLDEPLIGVIAGRVPGIDVVAAARIAALNERVGRNNGCRCAIVAVPAH